MALNFQPLQLPQMSNPAGNVAGMAAQANASAQQSTAQAIASMQAMAAQDKNMKAQAEQQASLEEYRARSMAMDQERMRLSKESAASAKSQRALDMKFREADQAMAQRRLELAEASAARDERMDQARLESDAAKMEMELSQAKLEAQQELDLGAAQKKAFLEAKKILLSPDAYRVETYRPAEDHAYGHILDLEPDDIGGTGAQRVAALFMENGAEPDSATALALALGNETSHRVYDGATLLHVRQLLMDANVQNADADDMIQSITGEGFVGMTDFRDTMRQRTKDMFAPISTAFTQRTSEKGAPGYIEQLGPLTPQEMPLTSDMIKAVISNPGTEQAFLSQGQGDFLDERSRAMGLHLVPVKTGDSWAYAIKDDKGRTYTRQDLADLSLAGGSGTRPIYDFVDMVNTPEGRARYTLGSNLGFDAPAVAASNVDSVRYNLDGLAAAMTGQPQPEPQQQPQQQPVAQQKPIPLNSQGYSAPGTATKTATDYLMEAGQ